MNNGTEDCQDLVLLIGSNPLPNYITYHLIQPEHVHLVHTEETRHLAENLRELFTEQGQASQNVTLAPIPSSTEPETVYNCLYEIFEGLPEGFQLHYTGGTKVMAAQARLAFNGLEEQKHNASYLDDTGGILRYDDNNNNIDFNKENLSLNLDVMLRMHGLVKMSCQEFKPEDPMAEDSNKIFCRTKNDYEALKKLFNLLRKEDKELPFNKASETPKSNPIPSLVLSKNTYPEAGDTKEIYNRWRHFLQGGWLEIWVAAKIKALLPVNTPIYTNIMGKLKKTRKFEIDVCFIHRNRLYLVSCTLGHELALCKSKLFEATMRARQMGGDLARAALVCLVDGSSDDMTNIDALRMDIAQDWVNETYIQVYGKQTLIQWSNGQTSELKQWLEV